ncbi:MAG TPA: winged helix-turn-helix domain-containing protein [Candidatus Acidoferrales bacterium]|nr:winged helix-turn-helix domain-containing protein [Candidatus Acidoferrales bacterium]
MLSGSPAPKLKFGPYEVDIRAGELRKEGSKIRLQEKPLRVLEALVAQPGTLVTREELKKRLWADDTFVDFETGLNTAVSKLREALNDDAEHPGYIETVPRRGYRFLARVENGDGYDPKRLPEPPRIVVRGTIPEAPTPVAVTPAAVTSGADGKNREPQPDYHAEASPLPFYTRLSRGWFAALALLILACAAGGYWAWRHERVRPANTPSRVMIAVLPFENLTGNAAEDYVSDGFTEEMITQLGELDPDQIGVIARTSAMTYKGTQKPVSEVARELGVNYVLEGSIRKTQEGLRVTAQLIRADDQTHIWAAEFDRPIGDMVKVEGEVAQAIAGEVQVHLTPQARQALATRNSRPVDPEAYRDYLRGSYDWNSRSGEGMTRAVAEFNDAVMKDPGYAPAYAGLANTYNTLVFYGYPPGREGIPKAKAAALKAIALDDSLAAGHASLGYVYFMWEMKSAEAEREFQRAIRLDENNSQAHQWYALYLASMGRREEATAQIQKAREVDPLSLIVATAGGYVAYFARDYDGAAAQCRAVLRQFPNFMVAHAVLGLAMEAKGDGPQAIAEFRRTIELSGARPVAYLDYLGHAFATFGQRQNAEAALAEIENRMKELNSGGTGPGFLAATLLALGEKDKAMDALEEGLMHGDGELRWLKVDPRLDGLRSEPRFQKLLAHAGFAP